LEAKTISLQQHETSAAQQLKSLEERLAQEESTVTALRQEISDKERQMKDDAQAHTNVCLSAHSHTDVY